MRNGCNTSSNANATPNPNPNANPKPSPNPNPILVQVLENGINIERNITMNEFYNHLE